MTIERQHNGSWLVYAVTADGHLHTMVYYGYTKREAVRLFRADLRPTLPQKLGD
jgi:hypothetical protein